MEFQRGGVDKAVTGGWKGGWEAMSCGFKPVEGKRGWHSWQSCEKGGGGAE